jgi:hypothetical protein
MASELTITTVTSYSKGNVAIQSNTTRKQITVTGNVAVEAVQSIGTSEETLALGEVATNLAGYAWFYNTDATNYVEIGNATGAYQIKLKAGEVALLRLDAWAAIYAKANTAAVLLQYRLFSD